MNDRVERFDPGMAARAWWRMLCGLEGKRERNRAALAELRRSAEPLDIAFVAPFGDLRRALHATADWQLTRAAMIAHVLAHVRDDDSRSVARALGPQQGEDGAVMSEARFRRLLQARDDDDLCRRFVRATRMLKSRANVADLATALWFWNDRTRREWAFQYLNTEPPDADRRVA